MSTLTSTALVPCYVLYAYICVYIFWRQSWFVSCCRCCDFHFKLSFKSIVSVMQLPVILLALFLFFHLCLHCHFILVCAEKRISTFDLLRHSTYYTGECVHDFHCTQQCATQSASERLWTIWFIFFFALLYLRSLPFIWPLFCQRFFFLFVPNG